MAPSSQIPLREDSWYIDKIMQADVKDVTKKVYLFQIQDFVRSVDAKNIHDLITRPKFYNHKLRHMQRELNMKHTLLAAVFSVLKHTGMKAEYPRLELTWKNEGKDIIDEFHSKLTSNIASPKQEMSFYDWNKVLEVRDQLPYGSFDHLLLSLYTYVPPRRQWDYFQLRVYTDPAETPPLDHNHMHVYCEAKKTGYIFLNEYKTAKYYKDFLNKDIPPEFLSVIKASMKAEPRQYLLQQENGEPYDSVNSFQKRVNRRLKKIFKNDAVTVNSLRHSFASLLKKIPDLSIQEWEFYAKKMGHSIMQSQQYAYVNTQRSSFGDLTNTSSSEKVQKEKGQAERLIDRQPECFKRTGNTLTKIDCPS